MPKNMIKKKRKGATFQHTSQALKTSLVGWSKLAIAKTPDRIKHVINAEYFVWLLCTRRIYDCKWFLAVRAFFMMRPYLEVLKNIKCAFQSIIEGYARYRTFYFPKFSIRLLRFQYFRSTKKDLIRIIDIFQPFPRRGIAHETY